MFDKNVDERLTLWAAHRKILEKIQDPFEEVWQFWKAAPFIPYNKNIDPYNRPSWPRPWDIIVHNKYDDFTRALMIGLTLKMTERFQNSYIEIKTLVDNSRQGQYNVVCVDHKWAINYSDYGPVLLSDIPNSFLLENIIEL